MKQEKPKKDPAVEKLMALPPRRRLSAERVFSHEGSLDQLEEKRRRQAEYRK